jgi:hypothetical protein
MGTWFSGKEEAGMGQRTAEVQCHRHGIPDSLARQIDEHYGALFASTHQLRLAGRLQGDIWVYRSHTAGFVHAIFLYACSGTEIRVLSEQISAVAYEVERFVEYLFEQHPAVTRILFFGLDMGELRTARPYQRYFCAEDLVIPAIGSEADYAHKLGKSTKRTIRRRSMNLAQRHPSMRFETLDAAAIDPVLVARIIGFNRARMASKNKVSTYCDQDAERLGALAAAGGLAGIVRVDGEIVAGSVCARVGANYYMMASGHALSFDEFSLGFLCCYWTAQACLRRGAREINLMGGRLDYKYALLGDTRHYDSLCVYRSHRAMLGFLPDVIGTVCRGSLIEARFALLDCERKPGAAAQLVAQGIRTWRAAKTRRVQVPS